MRKPYMDSLYGLPWWLRQSRTHLHCRRPRFDTWVRKIPWRRKWQTTPVLLPGKSHGQRRLVSYSPWRQKSQTPLSNWTALGNSWGSSGRISTFTAMAVNVRFQVGELRCLKPSSEVKKQNRVEYEPISKCIQPWTRLFMNYFSGPES